MEYGEKEYDEKEYDQNTTKRSTKRRIMRRTTRRAMIFLIFISNKLPEMNNDFRFTFYINLMIVRHYIFGGNKLYVNGRNILNSISH